MKFYTIKERSHILAYFFTDLIIFSLLGYGLTVLLFDVVPMKLMIITIFTLLIIKTILDNNVVFILNKESITIKYLFKSYKIDIKDITDISIIKYDDFNSSQKHINHRTNSDKLICIKFIKKKRFIKRNKEQIVLISPDWPELFLEEFNKLK